MTYSGLLMMLELRHMIEDGCTAHTLEGKHIYLSAHSLNLDSTVSFRKCFHFWSGCFWWLLGMVGEMRECVHVCLRAC